MLQKRKHYTEQEWLELIQQCRASGLTDKDWCEQNGITRSCFYYHVKLLRDKACQVPEKAAMLSAPVQHVVELAFRDDPDTTIQPLEGSEQAHDTDWVPAISIKTGNVTIEISNQAARDTICNTLQSLPGLC